MAQDVRVLKSNGTVNRTIAAVNYQAERLRQKCGDLTPDHNEILGAAVDLHHRNMTFLNSTLKSTQILESRNSSLAIFEVDEFDDDDDDVDSPRTAAGQLLVLDPGPSPMESADTIITLKHPGLPNTGVSKLTGPKRGTHDMAQTMLLRRMNTASRSVTLRTKSFIGISPQLDEEEEDDEPIFKELISSRGKSFLLRTDECGSAADDMLAQIRGSKWTSDNICGSKSARFTSLRPTDLSSGVYISRPGSRSGTVLSPTAINPNLSSSGLPNIGNVSASTLPTIPAKCFTAGKRPSFIPGASMDGSIPPFERASLPSTPSTPGLPKVSNTSSPSSGGLLSKLRKMVKN